MLVLPDLKDLIHWCSFVELLPMCLLMHKHKFEKQTKWKILVNTQNFSECKIFFVLWRKLISVLPLPRIQPAVISSCYCCWPFCPHWICLFFTSEGQIIWLLWQWHNRGLSFFEWIPPSSVALSVIHVNTQTANLCVHSVTPASCMLTKRRQTEGHD